jgi:hypothetical protein
VKSTRTSARFRRRLRVAVGQSPSFTIDISAGGFCAELMRVLPAGTPVEGSIEVKGSKVRFAGRVAWAKAGDSRLNLRGRMGVCFTHIAKDFARLVEPPAGGGGSSP